MPAAAAGDKSKPSGGSSGSGGRSGRGGNGGSKASSPSDASTPQGDHVTNTDAAPGSNSAPGAAGSSSGGAPAASSMSDTPDPAAAGGGSGGSSTHPSGAAGAGGAGGAEAKSVRERFIDAAIDALGGDAQSGPDGGMEPWRRSGGSAGGLSPDFVLPVLLTMRNSAVCFREVRRCVEMCVVLATDCKPCAADPECGQALKDVCGPTIGSCGAP